MKSFLRASAFQLVALAFLAFTLSCAGPILPQKKVIVIQPQPEPSSEKLTKRPVQEPERLRLFHEAEQAENQALYPEALEKYHAFLKTYPSSLLTGQARFSIGQIRERLGQPELATAAYQELLLKNSGSIFVPEARYRLLVLLIKTSRYDEAMEVLSPLLHETTEPEKLAGLYLLAGEAEAGRQHRTQALSYFTRAYNLAEDPNDKFEARARVLGTILKMPLKELVRARSEYRQEFPAGHISYITAYRYFREGHRHEAQLELNYFLKTFSGHELAGQAGALQRAIQGLGPPPPLIIPGAQLAEKTAAPPEKKPSETIGATSTYPSSDLACLMPLSGSASKYGHKVVKGLRLAFKLYVPQTEDFKSNLIVLDSGGDPDQTIQALDRLASQTEVLAVIGPLTTKVAEFAATRAEELSLPMLTLTQKEGIPQVGKHIFRLFLTPEAQARAVAGYAVQILGFTRLAILHPEDDYGKKMKDTFWDEINRLQAEIVGVQSYDPNTIDFSEQIQKLSGVNKVERKVEAGHAAEVNFEAVFLPDGYKAVAMIAPQFTYHDITTIRLLGTTLWHTPQLLTTAARYVQKSIFPTSFYPGVEQPEVQRFVKAFRQENEGQDPGRFEAYGFDAGTLLLTLMDKNQVFSRQDLIKALSNLTNFPGVTGSITFTPEGELKTEPDLLTVIGQKFKLVQ